MTAEIGSGLDIVLRYIHIIQILKPENIAVLVFGNDAAEEKPQFPGFGRYVTGAFLIERQIYVYAVKPFEGEVL